MEIRFTIFEANCLEGMSAEEFEQENCPIYGFFEMKFSGHREGEYFDFSVPDDYLGGESLSYWFGSLLDVLHLFQNEKTDYMAIRAIEYVDRWIEIKKSQEKVCLNVVNASDPREREALLLTSQLCNPVYEPPLDTIESYDSFRQEIVRAVTEFLDEINGINPELMKTQEFDGLLNSLHELEHK